MLMGWPDEFGLRMQQHQAWHHVFICLYEFRACDIAAESVGVGLAPARTPLTAQRTNFVVAVVDDDHSVLQSLEYLLESADYGVRLFVSAAAFLDSGCLAEVDCLISDVDMPGMDGFELLRVVAAVRPGLPTILVTGYPDRLKRLPSFNARKQRTFTKPFQGAELLAAVNDAIRVAS
jgi:FixJ family two-component response regulator